MMLAAEDPLFANIERNQVAADTFFVAEGLNLACLDLLSICRTACSTTNCITISTNPQEVRKFSWWN